jgi:predicted SAM-dependent methyltransferase
MAKGSVLRAVDPAPQGVEQPAILKLDIGCGKTTPDGWEGVDSLDFGQKHVFNVVTQSKVWYRQNHEYQMGDRQQPPDVPRYEPWGFADNSVSEVRSSHFVEHLTGEQRLFFFNELFRVMKPGATALIITPNWSHSCAYGDPTHQWPPMSQWFPLYLNKQWLEVNGPHVAFHCDFDHVVAGSWDQAIEGRNAEHKQFAMNSYTNAWRDLIVTLTKRA